MQKPASSSERKANPKPRLRPNAVPVLEFGSVSQKTQKTGMEKKYTSLRQGIPPPRSTSSRGRRTSTSIPICLRRNRQSLPWIYNCRKFGPMNAAHMPHAIEDPRVSTGIAGLDDVLGGG